MKKTKYRECGPRVPKENPLQAKTATLAYSSMYQDYMDGHLMPLLWHVLPNLSTLLKVFSEKRNLINILGLLM